MGKIADTLISESTSLSNTASKLNDELEHVASILYRLASLVEALEQGVAETWPGEK